MREEKGAKETDLPIGGCKGVEEGLLVAGEELDVLPQVWLLQ
jgi:hypothetical protein